VSLKFTVSTTDLVEHGGRQLALLRVTNEGRPRTASVRCRINQLDETVRLEIPQGEKPHFLAFPRAARRTPIRVDIDGQTVRSHVEPPRPWNIHVILHTHTDIGYTDYQPNIFRDFVGFLNEAMALVEKTRDMPAPARFHWTVETAFHLDLFERRASRDERRRLVQHLRRGDIEATACYLNMTDLPNSDQILRSFGFIRDFAARHRVPVRAGLAADINGLGWVVPAALHDLGVPNFCMSLNHDSAIVPLNRPMPFWWESADGKRVLVWHGEQYHWGNHLCIERGFDACAPRIASYLRELIGRGYPYRDVLAPMSGALADSAPPTILPSLTVCDWVARFANPTMRITTLGEWFAVIRPRIGRSVPVYRAHWPDYWAHGLGSAPTEIRFARETQHLLAAAGTAGAYVSATDRDATFPAGTLGEAYHDAAFGNEHTWGAFDSVWNAYGDFARCQWQQKRDYFYRARTETSAILGESLESIGRGALGGDPSVVVYNALSWSRDGIAELEGVHRPVAGYTLERLVDPETGRAVPYEYRESGGTYLDGRVPVRDVPATGYRVLASKSGEPKRIEWRSVRGGGETIENKHYRVRVDRRTGAIVSVYDRNLRCELVRKNAPLAFGRLVHETLPPSHERTGARDWVHNDDRVDAYRRAFDRATARGGAVRHREFPGWLRRLEMSGRCRGLVALTTAVTLHDREKRIDIEYRLTLPDERRPQALYVPFALAGAKPRLWYEAPGGAVEPGVDQIPTTCYDFYTVQNFVRFEAGDLCVTLVPRDTPLIETNELATFAFREHLPRFNGTVVSLLYNNYWHTNFPATHPGDHVFRFSLTSGAKRTHRRADSWRFAYEVANPLRARFSPSAAGPELARPKRRPTRGSFVEVQPRNVMLLSLAPADASNAYLFRLQETEGRRTRAVLRFQDARPRTAAKTDLFGAKPRRISVRGRTVSVSLAASELAALLLRF
jgi:hypothetical protein